MSPAEREQRLARSLEDYMVRRTRGDQPRPEDYAEELADAYDEFLDILDVEELLDDLLEPPAEEPLPREFGPYTLLREIGHGSAGRVYEAVHRELGRRDAVKILRPGYEAEGAALKRFKNGAKVLARVQHDHIVKIYDAGKVDDRPYYAMEFLSGVPLDELARSPDRPSARDLARGLAGVAGALQTMHDEGILHRDVKPQNIMVGDDGTMTLADFDLARSLASERLTRTGQALGTPLYMSPEQILAKQDDIDGRSDVYGLGATMYEALAGSPPFHPDDMRALMRMILSERPEPLRRVVPDVESEASDIVMKALEKKQGDRYQSAAAMRDDLLRLAEGERVEGRPVSAVTRRLRALKPFAWPIAAAVLLAVAWTIWYAKRPAKVGILNETTIVASVWMDGQPLGELGDQPIVREVPAGPHRIEARYEAYVTRVHEQEFDAGEEETVKLGPILPKDPNDLDAMAGLRAGYRFSASMGRYDASGTRDGDDDSLLPVHPAGKVRPEDLDRFFVRLPVHFNADKTRFVFTLDGKIVHEEEDLVPNNLRYEAPLPAAVVSAAQAGGILTWTVSDGGDYEATRTAMVVPSDAGLEARLARVDQVFAGEPTSGARAFFRARILLESGYAVAALREALGHRSLRGIESSEIRELPLPRLLVAREALDALADGADTRDALRNMVLGANICDAIVSFPQETREAWYALGED